MDESPWSLSKGDLIAGRYAIVGEIGRGGMGCVFEANDLRLERSVALKFLDPRLTRKAEAVQRFQREALAAGRIGHESICDVRDRGETESGTPFIVMELLEGESLEHVIHREKAIGPARMSRLVLQTLSALEAAHRAGIVHRDLKPENLFVTRDVFGLERIKILDFGISKFLAESVRKRLTRTGTVLGTPLYMSPEQAAGSLDIDHRTDIWSTGVIFYEAIKGNPPFEGDNYNGVIASIIIEDPPRLKGHVAGLSDELEAVIFKALEKDREERYQSAGEFVAALGAALEMSGEHPLEGRPTLPDSFPGPAEVSESESFSVTPIPLPSLDERANHSERVPKRRLGLPVAILLGLVVLSVTAALFLAAAAHRDEPAEMTREPVAEEDSPPPQEGRPARDIDTPFPSDGENQQDRASVELQGPVSQQVPDEAPSPDPAAAESDEQRSLLTKSRELELPRATKRVRPRASKVEAGQPSKRRVERGSPPPDEQPAGGRRRVIRGKHGSAVVADYPEE